MQVAKSSYQSCVYFELAHLAVHMIRFMIQGCHTNSSPKHKFWPRHVLTLKFVLTLKLCNCSFVGGQLSF